MSDTPDFNSLEAMRLQHADAVIKPKAEIANEPKARFENKTFKKAQSENSVNNVRSIYVNDPKYPVDANGKSTMIYTIGVTIGSTLDGHDDELERMQKAVTEFVRNIHNHID